MEAALQSSKEWVIAVGFTSSLGRGEQGTEEPVVSACSYPLRREKVKGGIFCGQERHNWVRQNWPI